MRKSAVNGIFRIYKDCKFTDKYINEADMFLRKSLVILIYL